MDGQGEAKIKPCGIYSAEDVVPDLEKYSSSRHGLVQLVRVKLTGDRAGNSTVTCTFTNTTGQTIVFYPELYTRTLAFYDCKDEHRCPIHPRVFVYMQMKPVRALSRTHPTRLQKWGSDQYTDVYEKAPEALSFYENLENVQTMTLEVCFRRHQIKDISHLLSGVYTNDIYGKIKMDVTIDSDTLSAEPARKDADESVR
jgi:hypothetical protein